MPDKAREARFHLAGWILFLFCAGLFLIAAIRDGDGLLVLASVVFLLGCIAFLVPLLIHRRRPRVRLPSSEQNPLPEKERK